MPTGHQAETRSIRLILMEFIDGIVMTDLGDDATRLIPQVVRQDIIYRPVEAESRIFASGVHHFDAHPRNYIIEVNPQHRSRLSNEDFAKLANPDVRVRAIDFGSAKLGPFEVDVPDMFIGH